MGDSYQGDIPGNIFQHTVYLPSRASDAANLIIPVMGKGHGVELLSAHVSPLTSQAGSATNFANLLLVNMGSGSTVGSTMASYSLSATAQGIPALMDGELGVVAAAAAKGSAERMGLSYASQGNGIALVAHSLHLAYRYT